MALLRLNAGHSDIRLHGSVQPAEPALGNASRRGNGPIIIMLHGYKYQPGRGRDCPQVGLFSCDTADGWPTQLGLNHTDTLGIAFGWDARGRLSQVFRRAGELGRTLARVIDLVHHAAPQRKINIIAHSMGAEITLSALRQIGPARLARIVLLTGASLASHAHRALASPAGRQVELLNVISRENDLFDFGFEQIVRAGRSLGEGIDAPNALSVQLDCDRTLASLAQMHLPIAPSQRRICHWSSYSRAGAMAFYKRFMCAPETLPLDALHRVIPETSDPRWWRLSPSIRPTTSWLRPKAPKQIMPEALAESS